MKKQRLTHVLAVILSLFMIALAACQGTQGTQGTSKENTSLADDMNIKHTINAVLSQHPLLKDVNDNAFTKWIEEKLNIDLVINPIMNSEFRDKMDIMMSTGEYPEVCLSGGYSKVDLYGPDEGVMIPLDEYINEENTPNILKADKKING